MKISIGEDDGKCTLVSQDGKVQIRNIQCAVEWVDERGIIQRFESSKANAIQKKNNKFSIKFNKKNCPSMEWEIEKGKTSSLLRLTVINDTNKSIKIKTLEPFVINQQQNGNIEINGSLAQANLLSLQRLCGDIRPRYLWEELYTYREFSSSMALSLYDKSTISALTLGFISTADMFGEMTFNFDLFRNLKNFSAFCNAEEIILKPGEKLSSEKLFIDIDNTASNGLDNYALKVQKNMNCNPILKPIIGWSTWDYYFGDISEENILENVDFLARHKQEIPVEYIQIDAGYTVDQLFEWENWNKRFPHGPKWLVKKINEKGFKAGLWLVPFWARKGSALAKEHPDWLVKDQDGNPVSPARNSFALDGTHPEVQKYLRELAQTITIEWGFEYIKIDGASMIGVAEGIRYKPNTTSCQAYRKGIEAFRSGMKGGTVFMGGVFGPSIGVVDAMRIGGDVGARWDGSKANIHAGERDRYHGCGNILRAAGSTLNTIFMNKRFWVNDSDYLVVRDDRSELSLSEAQLWATVTGFYGGYVILGDQMETLSQPRLEILKKTFPICDFKAVPVDFLKKEIPEILSADVDNANDHWKIVALFNYSDDSAVKTLSFADISLDSSKEYHVFGFWRQKYHGVFMNSFSIPLEAHSCEIIAIRENKNIPQVLGTDLHITQGGIELDSYEFVDNTLKIKTTNRGRTGNIFIFVPDGFEPADGLEKHSKNVWKYEVEFEGQTIECVFKH